MWSVEYEYILEWLDAQDDETVAHVFAAFELQQQEGPNLGRPLVDALANTRLKNLKELRPASPKGSEVRILFAFDPKRSAIMLLAGDKSKGKRSKVKRSGWYKAAIPKAEEVYQRHLRRLEEQDG